VNLDNVYELRDKVRPTASPFGLKLFAPLLDVSVGVAFGTKANDYRLAVRLRGGGPLHYLFAVKVRGIAHGEVDILNTGPVRIIGATHNAGAANTMPFGIGASIGHILGGGGTAGFFAKERIGGRVGVVSANHVIALQDRADLESKIVNPSTLDGGSTPVAQLAKFSKIQDGGLKKVDCAFAVLDPSISPNLSSLGIDGTLRKELAEPKDMMNVFKIGRTTNRTAGRIRAFDFDKLVVHNYRKIDVAFENQIEIESITNDTFSDPGDSGSLVYNAALHPVGLLFAETAIGGANNHGLHYANRIDDVCNTLEIDVEV
jgi:hypothetical protein